MSAPHPYLVDILREPVALWVVGLAFLPAAAQAVALIFFGRRSDLAQKARDERDERERAARINATKVAVASTLSTLCAATDMAQKNAPNDRSASAIWTTALLDAWPSAAELAEAYDAETVQTLAQAYAEARVARQNVAMENVFRGNGWPAGRLKELLSGHGAPFRKAWDALPEADKAVVGGDQAARAPDLSGEPRA